MSGEAGEMAGPVEWTPEQKARFAEIVAADRTEARERRENRSALREARRSGANVVRLNPVRAADGERETAALPTAVAKAREAVAGASHPAVRPTDVTLEGATVVGDGSEAVFLRELLTTHSVLMLGQKVRIARWTAGPDGQGEELQLFQKDDFRTFYEDRSVTIRTAKGETQRTAVSEIFFRRATRYDGVVLDPQNGPAVGKHLNLWRGFSLKPVAGNWKLMRAHIVDVLAGGDEEAADYIVKWSAWTVQNAGQPAEVALVFKGGKGTGKGTFGRAMRQLFGLHGLQISDREHLTGKFNNHLMHCCLLFADEAFWAGDVKGEGQLKRLITEPTLVIEPKNVNAFEVKNNLHLIMASNSDWVVPASHDERRYAVFEVSEGRVGDVAYFKALNAELKGGGLAAMLHDLMGMDLDGWHPRQDVPQTAALREQKLRSMRGVDGIVYMMAMEGRIPHAILGKPNVAETTGEQDGRGFWQWCKREAPELRYENSRGLVAEFEGWGFAPWKSGSSRGLKAPPLGELRAAIEKRYGPQEWPAQDDWGAAAKKGKFSLADMMEVRL